MLLKKLHISLVVALLMTGSAVVYAQSMEPATSSSAASPSAATGPSEAEKQSQLETEVSDAWEAAIKAAIKGPAEVPLKDQASLKLPEGMMFFPRNEAMRLLRAFGNASEGDDFVGVIAPSGEDGNWLVTVNFIPEGYIKDDDAKSWNADELLKNLQDGVKETNKERVERGFPEMEVVGWLEKPTYDPETHRLIWSILAKDKGEPADSDHTVNYNTYALGRDGYFSLNLLTTDSQVADEKQYAQTLLSNLSYKDGKKYSDFNATTDRVAAYGVAALVGGVAAQKMGLFAIIAAFGLKFIKIIAIGAIALAIAVRKFFTRSSS